MDFTPTDEQRMAVESIRRFLDEKLEPEIRAHGECFIERPLMQKWTSELAAFGHISAPHREEWGGLDMGWLTHLLIFEEIVYSSLDVAIPGFINEMWVRADETGTFRGQCAELCGKDHGYMPIVVDVVEEAEYQAWLVSQRNSG